MYFGISLTLQIDTFLEAEGIVGVCDSFLNYPHVTGGLIQSGYLVLSSESLKMTTGISDLINCALDIFFYPRFLITSIPTYTPEKYMIYPQMCSNSFKNNLFGGENCRKTKA